MLQIFKVYRRTLLNDQWQCRCKSIMFAGIIGTWRFDPGIPTINHTDESALDPRSFNWIFLVFSFVFRHLVGTRFIAEILQIMFNDFNLVKLSVICIHRIQNLDCFVSIARHLSVGQREERTMTFGPKCWIFTFRNDFGNLALIVYPFQMETSCIADDGTYH